MLILEGLTEGLERQIEAAIIATIRELKGRVTILVISHQAELVDAADVVYRLDNQRVHKDNELPTGSEVGNGNRNDET